jgi:hypothetical protein
MFSRSQVIAFAMKAMFKDSKPYSTDNMPYSVDIRECAAAE